MDDLNLYFDKNDIHQISISSNDGIYHVELECYKFYGFKYDLYSNKLPKDYTINNKTTRLMWEDGSETIIKRSKYDEHDKVKAFLWAYFQKQSGLSKNKANEFLKNLMDEDEKKAIELFTSGEMFDTLARVSERLSEAFKNMADTFKTKGDE